MNFIRFIIQRKVMVCMFFLGLSLLGAVSYTRLPLEIMPNVELPYLMVNVSCSQEVNPQYMEKQAIIPLEGAIGTMEGVSSLESTADQRRGSLRVYFDQNVNTEYAYLKLLERVNAILPSIPEEFQVRASKIDVERMSNMFMRLQVRGSGGLERIRAVIDKSVLPDLENIEGISNVTVTGGRQQSLEIVLDDEAVQAYGITVGRIRSLITQNNSQKNFVGHAYEKNRHYFVNVVADYTKLSDLQNIIIDPNGPVLLRDIATVSFGLQEQTTISRINGLEAATIQLVKDSNVNLIDLSHATRKVIDHLNQDLAPQDIQIVIQSDTAEEMERNINLIMQLALIGGLLAGLILWFFIRNLQLVATVLLSIPVSILVAFNFFYAFDISLNPLTLVGMALAVGMLLVNSVVVLENIYRHLSLTKDKTIAVVVGTKEVWRSVVASTLTTTTVFLPFIFSADYRIKIIGRHVGISIISTLLISLAVALLLIPVITHAMLKRSENKTLPIHKVSQKNRLIQIYTLLLKSAIRFPARTVFGAVIAFFVSIMLCMTFSLDVPREVELKQFNLYVTMSRGSTLEHTDEVVSDFESTLKDIEEIQDIITEIYEDGEEATVTVVLKDEFEKIKDRTIPQVKELIQRKVDNFRTAQISLSEPQASRRFGGGVGGNAVASFDRMFGIGQQRERIAVKGNDFSMLRKVADDIQYYLQQLESVRSANQSQTGNRPEIHLLLDNQLMSYNSVPISSVSNELASFESQVSSTMTYKQGVDEYSIVIRNQNLEEQKTFDDLEKLPIPNTSNASFELDQLGRIVHSYGLAAINRINQEKQIEVSYSFQAEIYDSKEMLQVSRDEVDQLIASLTIPPGVAVEVVQEESELQDFYFLIGTAFILIYMILASVFQSLSIPVVMMFTIPLATVGSLWALIFTGNSLFVASSLVGFLILLGVVVNNGIILIDYTQILQKRGYRRSRALMTAGQARIRPILITALTTIVAMVPLAMGKAEYVTQIGSPFAITVIGGLSLSTLFTLIFIPTVYSGLENTLRWLRALEWKIKLAQILSFAAFSAIIYYNVDSLLYRSMYLCAALVSIPGLTWLIMTSLRQARADFIKADQSLTINIRRLVKVYDDYTRFVREWKKGERMEQMRGLAVSYLSWRDFNRFTWQIPLMGFFVYFVYFYITSQVWLFILSHLIYFFTLFMWQPVNQYLGYRSGSTGKASYEKAGQLITSLIIWGFPFLSLGLFYLRQFRIEVLAFIAFIWYGSLVIFAASNRLHREKINIMRLTGRFAGLRRHFYRFVRVIPIIGKKKNPFSALEGVSLEITSGMFGLLGPNGAGKTTLMRVVCGVLNQSLGTIKINGIDFREKREELQGLIGYLPQEFGTYENMTAYEFLDYIGILKRIYDSKQRHKIVTYALESVHLDDNMYRKIGTFSGGMKQRIGIAMTLLHLPRILVVDEPTAGLDPRERIRFRNLLVELSRERIVIFSTHIIEDISSSCNKVAVLERGKLYYLGNPQQMTHAAEGKIWQFYADAEEFNTLRHKIRIVHHMQSGNQIRVRCIAEFKPHPGAENVLPTLEDAYLWLLGQKSSPSPESPKTDLD